MATKPSSGKNNAKSYYGKRPLWHWILLYGVIGIIVYGLVYYFVFTKGGNSSYNYNAPSQQNYNTK